jgi:hypothetical protein
MPGPGPTARALATNIGEGAWGPVGTYLFDKICYCFIIEKHQQVCGYKSASSHATVPYVFTAADPHSLLKHLQPKHFRALYGLNLKHLIYLIFYDPQNFKIYIQGHMHT